MRSEDISARLSGAVGADVSAEAYQELLEAQMETNREPAVHDAFLRARAMADRLRAGENESDILDDALLMGVISDYIKTRINAKTLTRYAFCRMCCMTRKMHAAFWPQILQRLVTSNTYDTQPPDDRRVMCTCKQA